MRPRVAATRRDRSNTWRDDAWQKNLGIGFAAEGMNAANARAFAENHHGFAVDPVRLPVRSPNLDAYAERFVRSAKSECVGQVIPLGERHLRRVVSDYVEHYHRKRNHQGIGNRSIDRGDGGLGSTGPVECHERLDGMLRYYARAA